MFINALGQNLIIDKQISIIKRLSGCGIWQYDIANEVFVFDETSALLLGLGQKSFTLSYDDFLKRIDPDCSATFDKKFNMATSNASIFEYSFRFNSEEKKIRILAKAEPEFDESNKIIKLLGIIKLTTPLETESDSAYTQNELKIQRAFFEELFQNSPIAIAVLDNDDTLIKINQEFHSLFGYTQDEAYGKLINDLIVPQNLKDEGIKATNKVTTGTQVVFETVRQSKEGNILDVLVIGKPIKLDADQLGIFAIYLDITERKQAEKALKESEDRLKNITKVATDVIWDWNLDTEKVIWSGNLKDVFGIDKNSMESDIQWWKQNIHAEDRSSVISKIYKVIESGQSFWRDEYRYKKLNGDYNILLDQGYVIHDDNGQAVKMVGGMVNVTKQREAEKSLKWELAVNSAIASISSQLISADAGVEEISKILLEQALEISQSKLAILEFNEYQIEENIFIDTVNDNSIFVKKDKSINEVSLYKSLYSFDLLTPYYQNEITHSDNPNLENLLVMPINLRDKTIGNIYIVNARNGFNNNHLRAIRDMVHLFALSFDRINAEDEIQRLNLELELKVSQRTRELEEANIALEESLVKQKELNILKTRFISMISHEYRTPLTVILLSTQIIKKMIGDDVPSKVNNHIEKIQKSVSVMTSMLEDVMSLGHSDEGHLEAHKVEINIVAILEKIVEELTIIDNNKHKLEFNTEEDELLIQSDPKLIRQIVSNLLSNAIKYSDEGTKIYITLHNNPGKVRIDVTDTGKGIAKEDVKNIFAPFYRNKEYIGTIPGTGLGLAIVKRSTKALGGEVLLESEEGKGATFSVVIPK